MGTANSMALVTLSLAISLMTSLGWAQQGTTSKTSPKKQNAVPAVKSVSAQPTSKAPAPAKTKTPPSSAQPPIAAPAVTNESTTETQRSAPRRVLIQDSWALGLMAWPEKIKITDEFGVTHDANVQIYTPSFHLARRETKADYGYIYEAFAFFGKADVQTEPGSSLTYFQKRVGVYGFGGAAGVFYRPESKQINIGVSAPIQYRKANFTSPPIGGGITKKDVFAVGLMFDFRWRINPDIAINQRVGTYLGQPGSLWMFNLEWTL
jgi:hypothetical protein